MILCLWFLHVMEYMFIQLEVNNYYTRNLDTAQYGLKVSPMTYECILTARHNEEVFSHRFVVPLFKISELSFSASKEFAQLFFVKDLDEANVIDIFSNFVLFQDLDVCVNENVRYKENTELLSSFIFSQRHAVSALWEFEAQYELCGIYKLSKMEKFNVSNAERIMLSQHVLMNLFGLLKHKSLESIIFGNYRDFEIKNPNRE